MTPLVEGNTTTAMVCTPVPHVEDAVAATIVKHFTGGLTKDHAITGCWTFLANTCHHGVRSVLNAKVGRSHARIDEGRVSTICAVEIHVARTADRKGVVITFITHTPHVGVGSANKAIRATGIHS